MREEAFNELLGRVRLMKDVKNRHTVNGRPPSESELKILLDLNGFPKGSDSEFRSAMRSLDMIGKI